MNLGDLNRIISAKELEDILYDAQVLAQEAEEYLQYDGLPEDEHEARKKELSAYCDKVCILREYIMENMKARQWLERYCLYHNMSPDALPALASAVGSPPLLREGRLFRSRNDMDSV